MNLKSAHPQVTGSKVCDEILDPLTLEMKNAIFFSLNIQFSLLLSLSINNWAKNK